MVPKRPGSEAATAAPPARNPKRRPEEEGAASVSAAGRRRRAAGRRRGGGAGRRWGGRGGPGGAGELGEEGEAVDVGESPGASGPDLDAGQVGGQVGRLAGREPADQERPVGRSRRRIVIPVERGHRTLPVVCRRSAGDVPVGPVG